MEGNGGKEGPMQNNLILSAQKQISFDFIRTYSLDGTNGIEIESCNAF